MSNGESEICQTRGQTVKVTAVKNFIILKLTVILQLSTAYSNVNKWQSSGPGAAVATLLYMRCNTQIDDFSGQ